MISLEGIPAAEIAAAPRVWRPNGAGARVKGVCPKWARERLGLPPLVPVQDLSQTTAGNYRGTGLTPPKTAHAAPDSPVGRILSTIAKAHRIKVKALSGAERPPAVSAARAQVAYTLRARGMTPMQIGRLMGGLDPESVKSAANRWPARAAVLGMPVDIEVSP